MNPSETREQALDWVVRTNDPDFDDWDGFTIWLERDPGNADAYHSLLASEAEVRPYLETASDIAHVQPAASKPRQLRRAGLWLLPAAAAAMLSVVVAPRLMTEEYSTRPGELRTVSLGGRDQIILNGGTKIQLAGWNKRDVHLVKGEILLRMQEPGAAGIKVHSGDLDLVDVGTVFQVDRSAHTTEVSVSEGAVVADPRGANLRLDRGEGLTAKDGDAVLRSSAVDPQSIGSFERGLLIYRGSSLAEVAKDLQRSTGLSFSVGARASALRFSGALLVSDVKNNPRSLEPLLGVTVDQSGRVWQLDVGRP